MGAKEPRRGGPFCHLKIGTVGGGPGKQGGVGGGVMECGKGGGGEEVGSERGRERED